MRRWVGAVVAGLCVASSGACHGHSGAAVRTSSAPLLPDVEFPIPPLDPGVMTVGPSARSAAGSAVPPYDRGGLRLFLDRCTLRAPGERIVDGRIVLPKGAHDVDATLTLALGYGDEKRPGQTLWIHRVTLSRSGPFAVVLPAEPIGSMNTPGLIDPRIPIDDEASDCIATVVSASVPVATPRVSVRPSITSDAFAYSAPLDSIQALGIGAPLRDEQDARTISLYTVWADRRSAITKVWIPVVAGERPALLSIAPSHPWCTQISVGIGDLGDDPNSTPGFPATADNRITVVTRLNCGDPDDGQTLFETHEPVTRAKGFTWSHSAYPGRPDIARRAIGAYEVRVDGGPAVTRDRIARVAATLTTRRNLATTGQPVPTRPATLDAALKRFLPTAGGGIKDMHERARFPFRGGSLIFLETSKPAPWDVAQVQAGHLAGGWWAKGAHQGVHTQGRCYDAQLVTRSSPEAGRSDPTDGGQFVYAITGDPSWTMQGLVGGRWQTIPTTNGVFLEDGTAPSVAQIRPIDTTGHVAACFLAENPSG